MAKSKVKYLRGGNAAKSFGIISNKLVELAPSYRLTPSETILSFIKDLENSTRPDYKKIIDKVSISGLSEYAINDLINYLKKMYIAERKKEQRDTQVEKHQIDLQEYRTDYINSVWEKLCVGADSYIRENDDKYLDRSDLNLKVWINIFENIDNMLKKTIQNETVPEFLKSEILKRVEDEIYFQEVKYFTEDFKFLAGIPEAGRLSPYGRKFIRYNEKSYKKMYNRYLELRELIPVAHEESVIKEMIKQDSTDEVTKRILSSRLDFIAKKKYEAEHGNVNTLLGTYNKVSGEER